MLVVLFPCLFLHAVSFGVNPCVFSITLLYNFLCSLLLLCSSISFTSSCFSLLFLVFFCSFFSLACLLPSTAYRHSSSNHSAFFLFFGLSNDFFAMSIIIFFSVDSILFLYCCFLYVLPTLSVCLEFFVFALNLSTFHFLQCMFSPLYHCNWFPVIGIGSNILKTAPRFGQRLRLLVIYYIFIYYT